MDLASVAAVTSAAVGVVTLGSIVFRTGKITSKLDQVDKSVLDLVRDFRDHVHEHGEKHTAVVERLSSLEAGQNGDGR